MKAISMDLRKRIVEPYDEGEGTRQEIADTSFSFNLQVSKHNFACDVVASSFS